MDLTQWQQAKDQHKALIICSLSIDPSEINKYILELNKKSIPHFNHMGYLCAGDKSLLGQPISVINPQI